MRKTFKITAVLCLAGLAASPLSAASQWKLQTSGVSSDLHSVHFIDANNGWAVGSAGVILHSADGGATWNPQTSGSTEILRDVQFINSSTGVAVGNEGRILKTSDGGATWTTIPSGFSDILYGVAWSSANTVWAVGQLGRVRKSGDGGNSWGPGDPGATTIQTLRSVYFVNASTGWACGDNGVVIRTIDGGANWTAATADPFLRSLRSIFFVNTSTGIVVGASGAVFKSTGSGTTWSFNFSTSAGLNGVHFSTATTARMVGDGGVVFKSTDSGTDFTAERSTTTQNLNKVFFVNANLGYAVGAAGTIVRFGEDAAVPVADVVQGTLKAINNLFDPSKGESTSLEYTFLNSGKVTVRIYNLQGRLVRVLVNEDKVSGSYAVSWDGRNEDGQAVASGIYLAHIQAPRFSKTQKIAVVQ